MTTRKGLHQGETTTEALASVIKEEPGWENVPAQVQPLLQRCLEKDPQKRLRHIGDVMALVDDAPSQSGGSRHSESPRHRWVWPAVVAVLLVVAAVALWEAGWARPTQPAELVRFQIQSPPAALSLYLSVSPDGRQLGVMGTNTDGQPILYLRAVNSLDWRPLPGTEGVLGVPFWSADSRFLSFWSNNKLRKIDIGGGPSQALCDATLVFGGFWTRDNKIVFGSQGNGLQQVSAEGGVPTRVTTLDAARAEGAHIFPSLLPDGRRFIYSSLEGAAPGIYLATLDIKAEEQKPKLLEAGRVTADFVPAPGSAGGRLLSNRDNTLLAQPFDPDRAVLTGEPVPVADRTSNYGASSGVLAYRTGLRNGRGTAFRQVSWVDRQGKNLGTATEPGLHNSIALSPDGTRVATARLEQSSSAGNNLDVWLTEFARGSSTRFTFFSGLDGVPIWSPDSSHVVFSSARSAASDLYIKASNSAGADELLLHSDQIKFANDWSRNGRFLLYTNVAAKTGLDLWVIEGMDRPPQERKQTVFLQTEFNETGGQFSPDGKWVAYTSDESGKQEVYVQPFPISSGGGGKFQVSKGGGSQPRWRRDGKEMYYLAPDNKLMAMDVATSPVFKASISQALFDTHILRSPLDQFTWDVSADGKRFLVVTGVAADNPGPITVVLNWQTGLKK